MEFAFEPCGREARSIWSGSEPEVALRVKADSIVDAKGRVASRGHPSTEGDGVKGASEKFRFFLGMGYGIVATLLAAGPSSSYSFSFADDAALNGERGQTTFVFSNVDGSGIDMTVTARDLTDGLGISEAGLPNPYLDDAFNGLPGGLGVCQGSDPACSGNPDDNLGLGSGLGEVLILSFSAPVTLSQVDLRNGIHELIFSGSTGLHLGAGNPTTAETFSNIFPASATLSPGLSGTRFSFVAPESFLGAASAAERQLYIESLIFIPEPGTGLLLGLGLALVSGRRFARGQRGTPLP